MIQNFISSRPTINHPLLNPLPKLSIHSKFLISFITNKMHSSSSSNAARAAQTAHRVPDFSPEEMERLAEHTLSRYTCDDPPQRKGKGVSIVWFRNDLRILDNEALFKAWISSQVVLPVYCLDPRLFSTTHYFGFPKTGALRAQFLVECLADLKRSLMKRGINLLIQHGKPEQILPVLAKTYGAHTVYAQKETCSEEVNVEKLVSNNLQKITVQSPEGVSSNKYNPRNGTKLELIWGCSMYHIDDLPFNCTSLPDVYTQFRKSVESKSVIRSCIKVPALLGPAPSVEDWGRVPEISSFGLQPDKARFFA